MPARPVPEQLVIAGSILTAIGNVTAGMDSSADGTATVLIDLGVDQALGLLGAQRKP